jgi:hypothetical protein
MLRGIDMRARIVLCGFALCALGGNALATDLVNQDKQKYTVKVQGEGKLSISTYDIGAGGTMYGLCGYSFCTFEIPGHKVAADKNARLVIRGGKFVK